MRGRSVEKQTRQHVLGRPLALQSYLAWYHLAILPKTADAALGVGLGDRARTR